MIKRLITLTLAICWMSTIGVVGSGAQERRTNHMTLGLDVGPTFGSIDGTAANIGISGDYHTSSNLSFGPLLQMTFTDDLTQVGFSGQLKYTLDALAGSAFHPNVQVGLGFVHADHDNWLGPGSGGKSDTSYLIPVGMGFEYRIRPGFYLSTTALQNFTNLDNSPGGLWQNSLNLLFGIRLTI
jgi:hypothetical protein